MVERLNLPNVEGQRNITPVNQDFNGAYNLALHYLESRQRSEAELRRYLEGKRTFSGAVIQKVIDRLVSLKLIDDKLFAQAWTNDRIAFRPKGKMLIKRELVQKGIRAEVIEDAISCVDDREGAMAVAKKHARSLGNQKYPVFYRRMSAFLARRGYNSEVIISTIKLVWESLQKK